MKKKIAVAVSLLLVLALSVGGTIAWLTDSDSVTNTFTIGNVDIALTETDTDNDGNVKANEYHIVPGAVYAKDPTITVTSDSEDCWLFVKITDNYNNAGNGAKYINYSVRTGAGEWTLLAKDKDGNDISAQQIYYREVKKNDTKKTFYVLTAGTPTDTTTNGANGVVSVNGETVTSAYVKDIADNKTTAPKLTFDAYAIQQQSFTTAAAAWAELNASH